MKSTRVLPIVVALALLLVGGLGITQARGPLPQGGAPAAIVATAFTYQGQLNKDGTPVNAICDMRFTLWDGPVGATQIGDPDLQFVEVTEGLFDVQVNAANEFGDSAFQGDARYLKIEVKCTGDAAFVSLGMAQRLTAAPYALSLRPGARIYGAVATGLSVAATTTGVNGQGLTYGLLGRAVATTGYNAGVRGESTSTAGWGVHGYASATTGSTYGVGGVVASNAGTGVIGSASATTGSTYGVFGTVGSSAGTGVYGEAFNAACTTAIPGTPCAGVYGDSDEGYGVLGVTNGGVALGARIGTVGGTGLTIVAEGGTHFIHASDFFPADTKFVVERDGDVKADGTFTSPAADMAELLPAAAGLEPGDVLVIGLDGQLARSTQAYQPTVVGVYSTKPAFLGGAEIEQELNVGKVPLAVVGVVPVKASAENGAIRPGDLLVASGTAGHAMRAGANPSVGTVIGKALAGLDKDTGMILMLAVLQ